MDDIKKARIHSAVEKLINGHDELVDLLPARKIKTITEEDAILGDALDSLEECIDCLTELLEE